MYRYILTCIDIASRYKVARPLKTKKSIEVAFMLEAINEKGGVFKYTTVIQCDNGSEFKNVVTKLYEKHNDDDEFDYIVKNSQGVLGLNAQYKNHPYAEEFTKQFNVIFIYGKYALEGKADSKFSLGDIWNLFQVDPLPNNTSNFCRQMRNCMKALNYIQKTSDLPLNTNTIKQAHKIMMDGEDILAREYIMLSVFVGYHIFAPTSHIERYMEDAIFRFHETKKDE